MLVEETERARLALGKVAYGPTEAERDRSNSAAPSMWSRTWPRARSLPIGTSAQFAPATVLSRACSSSLSAGVQFVESSAGHLCRSIISVKWRPSGKSWPTALKNGKRKRTQDTRRSGPCHR